jgi:biotin carboxyl carrier protein
MTFEVVVNSLARIVTVEPDARRPGRYRVTLDGHRLSVDARRLDAGRMSLVMLDGAGSSHEVTVLENGSGELLVGLRDGTVAATIDGRRRRRGASDGAGTLHGEQRIVAPMPGRVVRVAVRPGDAVAAKQGLVVVEAMKMENELTSPKGGRVKEVAVSEGMSVEAGRLLVVVE